MPVTVYTGTSNMDYNTIDPTTGAGVFASRIVRTLNSGFTALMISIGHRTGLFDVLAVLPPSTSEAIADASGLAERYVREWLAAMTSAHIVTHDARTSTYFLPIEYAAVLANSAGANSLAPAAQMLASLAALEDVVVAAFRSGGGVIPEAYERVQTLRSMAKRRAIDESYVEALLDLMPGMQLKLDLGGKALDIGCGDGALLNTMARMFPRSQFTGYDISRDAIDRACETAEEADLDNIEFALGDVASLDEARAYDLVLALESIHEQGFPRVVLRRVRAALKRGGAFLMQEAAASSHVATNAEHPFAPMLYASSLMHSVPVALSQEGEALGRMWGQERAMKMLAEAGFSKIRFETIAADALNYYCVAL
jgi:2-polyprenyl-3-methyl-5-hydroxy-6-metoxy-1,4-benzoquinol methylase